MHLAAAVAKVGAWRPEVRFNETTGTYFRRLAAISPPEVAKYYRDVLSADPKMRAAADDWLFENEPQHSSMLRTSVSPNIFAGGYRSNVIPSEAKATLDVRMLPDEDPAAFLEQVKRVVNDPAVEVRFRVAEHRPAGVAARLDSEPFKAIEAANTRIYNVPTLPTMSTFATDMAQLRAKGMQCYGIGRRSTSRTARRASACTAIRSACSRASSIASSASTTRSSQISPGRANLYAVERQPASRGFLMDAECNRAVRACRPAVLAALLGAVVHAGGQQATFSGRQPHRRCLCHGHRRGRPARARSRARSISDRRQRQAPGR